MELNLILSGHIYPCPTATSWRYMRIWRWHFSFPDNDARRTLVIAFMLGLCLPTEKASSLSVALEVLRDLINYVGNKYLASCPGCLYPRGNNLFLFFRKYCGTLWLFCSWRRLKCYTKRLCWWSLLHGHPRNRRGECSGSYSRHLYYWNVMSRRTCQDTEWWEMFSTPPTFLIIWELPLPFR
jgi:hypothetical protein